MSYVSLATGIGKKVAYRPNYSSDSRWGYLFPIRRLNEIAAYDALYWITVFLLNVAQSSTCFVVCTMKNKLVPIDAERCSKEILRSELIICIINTPVSDIYK